MDNPSIDDLLGDDYIPPTSVENLRKRKEVVQKQLGIPKLGKSKMVYFKNKKGEEIIGVGSHYYVVRMNGKLHYKAAESVIILPDDWKEGDEIPGIDAQASGFEEEMDDLAS